MNIGSNINTTGNGVNTSDTEIIPLWLRVFRGCFFSCHIVNVTGNIIISILIYKDCKFKSAPSKLHVNQAIADGIIGVTYIIGLNSLSSGIDPQISLTVFRVCFVVLYSESFQTLGAIAVTLYLAICHPVKFNIYNTTRTVYFVIVVTWIINVIVGCLFFASDDTFTNEDMMYFSFYRHKYENLWYELLKIVAMFAVPFLSIICFVKVIIYRRAQGGFQNMPSTRALVSQSMGVLGMTAVYISAFVLQIVGENYMPIVWSAYGSYSLLILRGFVYLYLVFKLPLFLLFFKSYRPLAKRMFCSCLSRNQTTTSVQTRCPAVCDSSRDTRERTFQDTSQQTVFGVDTNVPMDSNKV